MFNTEAEIRVELFLAFFMMYDLVNFVFAKTKEINI
jgi:hypothetical protein